MESKPHLKYALYILVASLVVLVLGVSFNFIDIKSLIPEKPYEIVKPDDGFVPGTTVNLYKNAAPGFPGEVLLEEKIPYHSASVNTPDGKKQIIVSYISEKSPIDVANMYIAFLPSEEWDIKSSKISKNVSVIQASHDTKTLVLTVSPGASLDTVSSLVTFQYTP